ncbi:PH domain-containing protein [Mobilicoccus massiliensis]|uniref:PH domain-containing protein n=1 Tax=Mobilicoccus massiliensis TaxID=1522310 RepID=UPI0009E1C801|nr:PH domain-containing protein [Mobilicoccus massiliensis]
MDPSTGTAESPLPPDSWPGAAGKRSVAPEVAPWPGQRPRSHSPGASWPGATSAATATAPPRDLDDAELRDLRLRRPANLVSPKAKLLWRLGALLGWVIPLVGVVVWMIFDDAHRLWQGIAIAVVLLCTLFGVLVVPWWRYRVHRWEVTDSAVYTQSGWLFQERRIAPISRIQTVDSEFGPLEQMFGLGTLTVTTASAAGPLRVAGLDKATVERLVSDLTRITALERGDAT